MGTVGKKPDRRVVVGEEEEYRFLGVRIYVVVIINVFVIINVSGHMGGLRL